MPDSISLSENAVALLKHIVATKDVKVTPVNLEAYRELARAEIMTPMSGMVGGAETHFIFTESGWRYAQWTVHQSASL